jgi:hypothetical protein
VIDAERWLHPDVRFPVQVLFDLEGWRDDDWAAGARMRHPCCFRRPDTGAVAA